MGYRKLQADRLFDGEKIWEEPVVLICDQTGKVKAFLPPEDAGEGVQRVRGLLCPGFVNTHCHLELSHMAGLIPPGTGMVDFLLQVMSKRDEAPLNPVDAAREADRCMREAGIVCVGDISNNISTLPLKAGSDLHYHTFVEVAGFLPDAAGFRVRQAMQVYTAMGTVLGEDRVSLVPHAPYSVSKPLFEALNKPGILSIHNQESPEENEFYQAAKGDFRRLYDTMGLNLDFFAPYHKSSLQVYLPWLSEPGSLILVHNTATSREDMAFSLELASVRKQQLFWCLCPGANRYIRGAVPPVPLLRELGCMITLGTDSLASNRSLSILSEMEIIHQHFPEVPLDEILGWATRNGARALGMEGLLGSFSPGARPGVLLLGGLENSRITGSASVKRLV